MLLGLMFIKLLFRIRLQLFCSGVVVQNVNVISSPTIKVLFQKTSSCFTNQMFYVRNMPIRSYTINKITFIINTITITTIIIIILIFNFNITIISSSSSSSSSPPLSLNPSSSSSLSVSFYISSTSEVCVSPSYLNSSVFFLTTCFLLFIGLR